jgi:predicted ABC-type ATPase
MTGEGKQIEALNAPSVVIFAGPNGSGKSTISKKVLNDPSGFDGEYINADDIAKSLEKEIPDYAQRNLYAAKLAADRRVAAIKEGRPFAFETVMSTPEKIALMTQTKSAGYTVSLVFVTTDDAEKNVQRVANRVALGGHAVEPAAIRHRYHSAMGLLACAVEHSDEALIVDNSKDKHLEVAMKRDNRLELTSHAQAVSWVEEKLVKPYQEREASRREMIETYQAAVTRQASPLPPVLSEADASNGKRYGGKIIGFTSSHALQQTGANVYVLHDRALSATKDLIVGQRADIQYSYDKGKIADLQQTKELGKDRQR